MDIFSIITLIGGLALFLYGMEVMSSGLEKAAGSKMEQILRKLTSNRFSGLALGAGVTAVVQSSSAVTVMLVGLVNSGIMQLSQAISVIMGSNIGTTITAWILSLTGINSDNVFINLLKPANFSPIIAFIGAFMLMMCKKPKKKNIGTICLGFAILMYGMEMMSGAVSPLADVPEFANILTLFTNPILGVLVGTVFTAIIQSSSASVGVLQALSLTGVIPFSAAVPIIMGQNIGTCISAVIASAGANRGAKRVAVVHVCFNIIGTVIALPLWLICKSVFNLPFANEPISPLEIAIAHSIFNVFSVAILFPFAKKLEKLANIIIKDSHQSNKHMLLDERLFTMPSVAVSKAINTTEEMAEISKKSVIGALTLLTNYSEKSAAAIKDYEDRLDKYEDALGTYLIKLSKENISSHDSKQISKMLHTISDFERIGDHAVSLSKSAEELHIKNISFSQEANREMQTISAALSEIVSMTLHAFVQNDLKVAEKIEPLEQVIDTLTANIRSRHIARLKAGNCTVESGFILLDILTGIERISDHCSNIAVAIIELSHDSFDTHSYLQAVKSQNSGDFAKNYSEFLNTYSLN